MTYEEREKELCRECSRKETCPYIPRKVEYKCQHLSDMMYGWELGWQDAIDKAFDFLIERYENQGAILLEDINDFKKYMEEQQ